MTKLKWQSSFNNFSVATPIQPLFRERLTTEQKKEKAEQRAELLRRSELARYKAMVMKFGLEEAIRLGVPRTLAEKFERQRPQTPLRRKRP